MSQPIRPTSVRPSSLRRAVILPALVAILVAGPALAQSSDSAANPPSPEEPLKVGGKEKKEKKAKEPKLSKEQKRRLDIEAGGRTAIEWYQQAVAIYRAGKYLDARAILLPLEDSARAIDIQEKVKLLIADTYFAQGGALNLAEALARYKSFATFFPTSEHGEYVQFQIGRSYFKQLGPSDRDQSYTDSVVAEYRKFLDLYPKSQYAEQAQREMTEAVVLRARHEFKVGQFYWEWKDYRACSTRLKSVLAEWPELPEREKALWMCSQSLYNSGARAEGDSYAARLAADYPASAYTAQLDAGAAGGRTIQAQLERQRKADKQADRTHRRQISQDRKRTRQIRKDSGLPADVPGLMTASSAPSSSSSSTSTASSTSSAASAEPASSGASAEQAARDAELIAKEKARAEQAEMDEQAEDARKAEQEAQRAHEQQAEADKAAAKEAERLAKTTPEEAEKQAAEQAEKAARDKAEADRLEAEEAAQDLKKAEAQKKRDEKAAAEAAKKAAKKAKKKG